jgi:hypothetical protein
MRQLELKMAKATEKA